MLRRFRPVLLAAAVAFATPPLAAQLPGRRPAEVAPAPHPVVTLEMPASLAGGAEAALGILSGATWRVVESLPGVGFQTVQSGMTLPSPHYLNHYPQYFPADPEFPLPRELAAQQAPPAVPAAPAAPKPAPSPIGTWVREVGPGKVVLTVTADRITATARVWPDDDGKPLTITLDADYVVMKDGTVCGIITGIDADDAEASAGLQSVAGHPFALRWRADAEVLSVREVRCLTAGMKTETDDELSAAVMTVAGRYTRMDEAKRKEWEKKTPAGKAPMPRNAATRCAPLPSPIVRTIQTLPDGTTVERLGADFNGPPLVPAPTNPPVPGSRVASCPSPVPLGPPLPTSTYLPPPPLPGGGPAMVPPGAVGPLDPPPGPWTITPTTPWQQAGPMFPGPRPYPQPIPVPYVQPAPVVQAAAAAPAVGLPPPPPKRAVPVAGVSVAWHPRVVYLPDVTRRGVETPCLVGRLFLFDAAGAPLPAAGGVKVVATDDTPRDATGPKSLPEERWSFDLDAVKRLLAPVPEQESHYTLVLPWAGYRPDATRVRLAVQYDQPYVGTTWAPEVVLNHPADLVRPLPQPPAERPTLAPAATAPACPVPANPLVGTWTRDIGAMRATLTIGPKQIHGRFDLDPNGEKDIRELVFTAEYTVSPDARSASGTVTGADVKTSKRITYFESGQPLEMARELSGQPIAFDFRAEDGVLSIGRVRVGTDPDKADKFDALPGVYSADVPQPRPAPRTGEKCCPPAAAPAAPNPFRPAPPEPRSQAAPPADPLLGTWVREQDGLQVVLRLGEKRMTLELNMAVTGDGEAAAGRQVVMRVQQSFDADYGIGPDGTVFGVLTGGDVKFADGVPPEERVGVAEIRGALAKVVGNVFKFRVRLDGGKLAASGVRLGPIGEKAADGISVADDVFAGRYERAGETVPPPKPGSGAGSFRVVNQYSSDPNVRIGQLLKESEDLRQLDNEWKRFWFSDRPSHITPDRVPGGAGPKQAAIPASR